MTKRVGYIEGDGVGPELMRAALKVLDAVHVDFELIKCEGGYEWWLKHGGPSMIPPSTWEILEQTDACLKAPTTTPAGPGTPKSVAVSIRQRFQLYANVRPIRTFEGTRRPLGDVDFICVREATEDLYAGIENRLGDDIVIAYRVISRKGSERVAKKAFEIAKEKGWSKVIAVTKRNILKETDGLFFECVEKVKKDYANIELEEYFIDNFAQQLIKNPQRFNHNVILGTNLFMDIISEEASALVASIGMIYTANLGDRYAMFEPAHGSSPKYKGLDKVNPTAMILSAAWLAEYLGEKRKAQAIFRAAEEVIAEGKHVTYDLGGQARLSEMAEAIAKRAGEIFEAT